MKYFTIEELSHSETANRKGIDNTPTVDAVVSMTTLINECLDPVRELYGKPITVTSGFRCPMLNKAVGGVNSSQHVKGEAADLVGRNDDETRKIFETAKAFGQFDQLLYEKNSKGNIWVHISYKASGNRTMCIDNYKG